MVYCLCISYRGHTILLDWYAVTKKLNSILVNRTELKMEVNTVFLFLSLNTKFSTQTNRNVLKEYFDHLLGIKDNVKSSIYVNLRTMVVRLSVGVSYQCSLECSIEMTDFKRNWLKLLPLTLLICMEVVRVFIVLLHTACALIMTWCNMLCFVFIWGCIHLILKPNFTERMIFSYGT